ncbi:MAG: pantetheine-phosphate adenylyltransferase [Clostridiales bacterium]|jgi:pantetheine-phosphate adenylyltransferase|nr:pantetheine-phosphate adenylyltransferase [Clostridiales bacterium]
MKRKALYAGSFDPITNGHLNIIQRAASMYDELIIGVIENVSKEPLFSLEDREHIVKEVTADIPNVKVESFSGLLADYVNNNNFQAIIRGLRATTDFEYEISMAQMNARLLNEGIETVFLMTDPRYSFISSSLIKEVVSLGGDVEGLIPEYTANMIKEKLGQ